MQKTLLFLLVICMLLSCKNLVKNGKETVVIGNDYNVNGLNPNYDWTGTYELKDDTTLYTLKLHKRSVDGNYEMQFNVAQESFPANRHENMDCSVQSLREQR